MAAKKDMRFSAGAREARVRGPALKRVESSSCKDTAKSRAPDWRRGLPPERRRKKHSKCGTKHGKTQPKNKRLRQRLRAPVPLLRQRNHRAWAI